MDTLEQLLTEEEGNIPYAYQDSRGLWTIGVGHLIDQRAGGSLPPWLIMELLHHDITVVMAQGSTQIQGFGSASSTRQAVVCSMLFQLGLAGLREFKDFLAAFAAGDYARAADAGRSSKWARQDSPRRARREMYMMSTGLWLPKDGIP